MNWKTAFTYAKSALGARSKAHEAAAADQDLPFGARIGSVVMLQTAPFLRAAAAGTLLSTPENGGRIVAISRLRIPMSGRAYRYYLSTATDLQATEVFLQLYVDPDCAVREAWYCQHLSRIYPATVEEQLAFTGERGHGLGEARFTVWREQLASAGLPKPTLDAAFRGEDCLVYDREAGGPEEAFVPPYRGMETRIDDATGAKGLSQDVFLTPYVRALTDGSREYLLISTEVVHSIDGDASKRSVHVDFMVGLPLEKERFTVQ